ncbi:transcription repressor NadR [Oscillibacter ruminantium]|jgi:transcriptional regulator of NAD metabolism|uniref:transcription repressor NadR n=1 Tax=Oscillibacter ruminantium TaxID=1263547 RepID=UPI0002E7D7E0|nr:transcription repressor NadR [Oscillibacter ruminantium]MDN0033629.1 transcription repressor NadR [Oscillibacter valericigenes]
MQSDERRAAVRRILEQTDQPVSASALAAQLGVSRQVIVGDVALLRAGGLDVSATPRGYMMKQVTTSLLHQVACRHDAAGMRTELNVMVDHGCTVLDVVVEHPIYGQLTGPLQMSSRYDVEEFLRRCDRSDAKPLSDLTEGIHLHTLACPDEAAFQRVLAALGKLGILLQD